MKAFKAILKNSAKNQGFVLPIVLTMGTVTILVGVAAIARSHRTRLNSYSRAKPLEEA